MDITGCVILTLFLILARWNDCNDSDLLRVFGTAVIIANLDLGVVFGVRLAKLKTHSGAVLVDISRERGCVEASSYLPNECILHYLLLFNL